MLGLVQYDLCKVGCIAREAGRGPIRFGVCLCSNRRYASADILVQLQFDSNRNKPLKTKPRLAWCNSAITPALGAWTGLANQLRLQPERVRYGDACGTTAWKRPQGPAPNLVGASAAFQDLSAAVADPRVSCNSEQTSF